MSPPRSGTSEVTDRAGSAPTRQVVGQAFGRLRVLALAALGPLITGYAAVAALFALVTMVASRASFSTSGVLDAAFPGWLAAHQVPLRIDGQELGALPLVPTIGVAVLVGRTAAGVAERLGLNRPGQTVPVVLTIAGAHALFGLIVAVRGSGDLVGADPLAAAYYPALLAGFAATVGLARRCGLVAAAGERIDDIAAHGLRAGAFAVLALLTVGAAVLTLGLVTSVPTARDLFAQQAPGFGNGLGMMLLSVGYLPNGVVAGTSFAVGPGLSMGSASVSPLDFTAGPVPALPLLAALPEQPAGWWPLLFVLPLGVGVLVGHRLRAVSRSPLARLRAVGVAAAVVALIFVILSGCAGGRLGIGPFDPLSLRAPALSVAMVVWIGVPAGLIVWFAGPRSGGRGSPDRSRAEPARGPVPGRRAGSEDDA